MITRFAPSPTGLLHLGHAYSALIAFQAAQAVNGRCLLRLEDIDQTRCRPAYEQAIYDDLHWLGLCWPAPVMRQSDRQPAYDAALAKLVAKGLCYPCGCSRTDIKAALSAPQEGAPMHGPDGLIYPGTCRARPMSEATPQDAIRLNMAKAAGLLDQGLSFTENGPLHAGRHAIPPEDLINQIGDIVLARKGIGTSYHLAVTVDDAAQGITHVIRGADLFSATPLHVLLQALLTMPSPQYHHHDLIRDETGKRLAKRDDDRALQTYRAAGATPQDIRAMVGL